VRGSRWLIEAALLLGLQACTAREGALLARDAVSDAGQLPAAVRPNMSLQYQLTGQLDTHVDAQLFVIDLFDSTSAQVAELHAAGRVVIAYLSVGSLEGWRDDAAKFPSSAIGTGVATYPDERWLDFRSAEVRALMQQRLDRAVEKGFDGVFASTLGGYLERSGFDLTRADQLDYDMFIAARAHARGLNIGLSDDLTLDPALVTTFDWVLTIDCIASHDCDALAAWQARKRPVFDLETEGDHATVCMQASAYSLAVTFKHTTYDAFRDTCP
jgi:hypothetical protein